MAGKTQQLYSEIEQAQAGLRECIEHSRRLVERSDALIRRVKDQPPERGCEARATHGAPPAPVTPLQ